jgi:hypothetical protein
MGAVKGSLPSERGPLYDLAFTVGLCPMHDNRLGDGRIDLAEPGWKLIGLLKDPSTGANLEARGHT